MFLCVWLPHLHIFFPSLVNLLLADLLFPDFLLFLSSWDIEVFSCSADSSKMSRIGLPCLGKFWSCFLAKCRGSFSLAPNSLKKMMLSCSVQIANKQRYVCVLGLSVIRMTRYTTNKNARTSSYVPEGSLLRSTYLKIHKQNFMLNSCKHTACVSKATYAKSFPGDQARKPPYW